MGNIQKIASRLADAGLDALMITSGVNRLYATGFQASDGLLLVTRDEAFFFTDSRYIEAAEQAVSGAAVLPVDRETTYAKRVGALIDCLGLKRLGFEDGHMPYAQYVVWREKLPAQLVPAQEVLSSLRAVKSREELAGLVKAQRVSEKSFEEILPLVGEGLTEKELAAELVCRFLKNGAEDRSFDPIVVSGVRTSMPHGRPGDFVIGAGFLTMDFGVRLEGWCSDTTRTLCVGQPTEEMVRVYDTVLRAQAAGISAARAGVTGTQVDRAARDVIEAAGYGPYFGHGFGHGLGLEVHEMPNASPMGDRPLAAGALISAEPGIYLPGQFGVRIEDVLYITEDGAENITRLPKTLQVIG